MSGAEAGAVLGLISSIITIIETAKELYEAANDANGHSEALNNAAAKLPLIQIILKNAEISADLPTTDLSTRAAIMELLKPDEKRAYELVDILEKVVSKERASTFNRYRAAIRKMMKGGRVDSLIKAILQDMIVLSTYFSCPKNTKMALKEALDEVQSTDLKALKGFKYNAYPSYSDLTSIQGLKDFLYSWLLPESSPTSSFASDHELFLEKRFINKRISYSTCEWVFNSVEYSNLVDPAIPSILRVKGPSGCGKSVLLSAVIDRLQNPPLEIDSSRVLYCYAPLGEEPIGSTAIVRVFLAQTIGWDNDRVLEELHKCYSNNQTLLENDKKTEEGMWRLLRTIIALEPRKINIIVDGLDECAQPLACVQYLVKLVAKTKAGVLLSSRREGKDVFNNKTVQLSLKKRSVILSQLEMTPERTYEDLTEYVTHRVTSHPTLSNKSEHIREKIIRGVCQNANGMFLYASLVLEDLKGENISSISRIDSTLANLPQGLFNIYRQHLGVPRGTTKGPEALSWIFGANSALSWHELQSALAIGEEGYDEDEIVHDSCEAFIEHSCGQLVESYGEPERLRFIHPTVKDFLSNDNGPGAELGIPRAHSMIASKLLRFLQYSDLPYFSSADIDDNPETIIRTYSQRTGRGLYSFATFNWYKHLKESDKSENAALEQQVLGFIKSQAMIRWLKGAIVISHATGYGPIDSVSLTANVVDSLRGWILERKWSDPHSAASVQAWINDFVDLMLDWGKVLEIQPDWLDYIHYQLLPDGSYFRDILEEDGDQSILQFQVDRRTLTRSSQLATWPDHCFATDEKRDLAFAYDETFISCYHMQTGLLTAEIQIETPPKVRGKMALRHGVLSSEGKYLAVLLEVSDPSPDPVRTRMRAGLQLVPNEDGFSLKLENAAENILPILFAHMGYGIDDTEFVVVLIQLDHARPSRTCLFGLPSWSTTPILTTGRQPTRWELDDVDTLKFSPDSSRLATPFGVFNVESGGKTEPWNFALAIVREGIAYKGGKVTDDLTTFGIITQDVHERLISAIELREVATGTISQRITFSGLGHLLAISNGGRFLLVLRVQSVDTARTRRVKGPLLQQGSIEIWDCHEQTWTQLLVLETSASGFHAPWKLLPFVFPSRFSPEAKEHDEVNRVLLYVPSKWNLSGSVRNRGSFNSRQDQILLFEAKKTGNPGIGFGKNPTLRLQLPATAFGSARFVSSANLERISSYFDRIEHISDQKLTILSWGKQFDRATLYVNGKVISMTQEEMKAAAMTLMKTIHLSREEVADQAVDSKTISTLVFSSDGSAALQVRVCVTSTGLHNNLLLQTSLDLGIGPANRTDIQYEVFITCLGNGEHEAESSSVQHALVPGTYYPALESQYICALDNEHLTIGCLELDLSQTYEGVTISIKDPRESIFQRALTSFKTRARPFNISSPSALDTALIELDSPRQYTIFSELEIRFAGGDQTPEEVRGAFVVHGTNTSQDDLHIFQFSKRLQETEKSTNGLEAHQFEVFICIFNEPSSEITWFMHTTTAGETSRSQAASPETSWALHPHLPLLVWLLPGHGLKLSNIESTNSPVTIAESITIEENSTNAIRFSPDGRYIALQAQETFRWAFTHSLSQTLGTVMVCDLVKGETIVATPTTACNVTIDLDDEFLYTYHLTRDGAIEANAYNLTSLELSRRQYLTFIPTGCCCSTCGHPMDQQSSISVIEQQGVTIVALGHTSMKIGISTLNSSTCDPLLLRITSPPIELNLDDIHDVSLTISSRRLFPMVLDGEGEMLDDASAETRGACTKEAGGECSCHECRADIPRDVTLVKQMSTLISDFKLVTGELLPKETVEDNLRRFEAESAKKNAFAADSPIATYTIDDAKALLGDDLIPWDSWAEFKDAMEEIKDEYDFKTHLMKFYGPENCGIGCRIPLLVQTFSFHDKDETDDLRFQWSSSIGFGWIEEHVQTFHELLFGGDFVGTRRWYTFPAFHKFTPKLEALLTEDTPEGRKFRKYFTKDLQLDLKGLLKIKNKERNQRPEERPLAKVNEPETSLNDVEREDFKALLGFMKMKNGKIRMPAMVFKDGGPFDPMTKLRDVLDALSDRVPGLGDLFQQRLNRMLTETMLEDYNE